MAPALSLAGIPPLSGFVPKFALLDAGFSEGQYLVVTASLVASLLTLFSVVKIWIGVFWSPILTAPTGPVHRVGRFGGPPLMVLPTVALFVLGLAVAVYAGPLYDLCSRAADDLLHPDRYVRLVLGP